MEMDDETIKELNNRALRAERASDRQDALWSIGKYLKDGGEVEPFINTLNAAASNTHEKDGMIRGWAVCAIGDYLEQNDDISPFKNVLRKSVSKDEPVPGVRLTALQVIGQYLKKRGEVEPFIDTLNIAASKKHERDPDVRVAAVVAIGEYLKQEGSKVDPFQETLQKTASEQHGDAGQVARMILAAVGLEIENGKHGVCENAYHKVNDSGTVGLNVAPNTATPGKKPAAGKSGWEFL